ncbi:TPA: hypothetical protein R2L21_001468, partial [Campylobacter jejuni]|nr:hypothetical protein [Campylobacter jejuni]
EIINSFKKHFEIINSFKEYANKRNNSTKKQYLEINKIQNENENLKYNNDFYQAA